jgi:polysaccharide deacetylase 2 family uncharacterized protein YibQ
MKRTPPPKQMNTMRFIAVAAILMLIADHFIFGGTRGYIESARDQYEAAHSQDVAPVREIPTYVDPGIGQDYFESTLDDQPIELPEQSVEEDPAEEKPLVPEEPQAQIQDDVPLPDVVLPRAHGDRAKVAIIIDDLGIDAKRSKQIIDLPSPMTLAFLPYGTKTKEYASIGKAKGHSLMIHTPMEAMDAKQNIGPGGLKTGMDEATFVRNFEVMLESFDGYGGINNHMGSRLTQDEAAMKRLMVMLKERGLYFVDSKTISTSVAAHEARRAGVPYAVRNVFLDHEDTRSFVDSALIKVEKEALKHGTAIAIGHPKDATIAGLQAWIPTLAAKGIDLVPVSDLLVRPSGNAPKKKFERAIIAEEEIAPQDQAPAAGEPIAVAPASPVHQQSPLDLQIELPAIY